MNLARAVPTKGLKFKLKEIKDGEEAEQDIQYAAGHSSASTTRHYNRSKASGPSLEVIEHAVG